MAAVRFAAAFAVLGLVAAPAFAQTPAPTYGPPIGLEAAKAYVAKAEAAAKARGFTMAIAVVEPTGDLVAYAKMDGTQYGSVGISIEKARTAARFKRATKVFSDGVGGGRTVLLSLDQVVAVEGGVPILKDGKIIGAIGLSGGTSEEDGQIAAAALAGN